MALILQSPALVGEEEQEPVVGELGRRGAQRVSLGFRVCGFGAYHFLSVYFEETREASLPCGPFHSGPLSTGLYSYTVRDGWGCLSLWQ